MDEDRCSSTAPKQSGNPAVARQERFDALNLPFARPRRTGLRWEIIINGSDDIDRPLSPINPKFWRYAPAARIASCINREAMTAAWEALEPQPGSLDLGAVEEHR